MSACDPSSAQQDRLEEQLRSSYSRSSSMMPRCVLTLLIASLAMPGAFGAARPIMTYNDLAPLANIANIRGVWNALKLPELPETFCHVGLLGWHCHNTTGGMQPWNPASLIPKEDTPPMPADASCIICPQGWHGQTKSLIEALIDVPIVQKTGKLPAGSYYDLKQLQAASATAAAAAAALEKSGADEEGATEAAAAGITDKHVSNAL